MWGTLTETHLFVINDFPPNSGDWATINNKKDCIGVLLEFKADTEIENKEGDRPVDIAVKYNLEDVTVRKSGIILNSRKCCLLQAWQSRRKTRLPGRRNLLQNKKTTERKVENPKKILSISRIPWVINSLVGRNSNYWMIKILQVLSKKKTKIVKWAN